MQLSVIIGVLALGFAFDPIAQGVLKAPDHHAERDGYIFAEDPAAQGALKELDGTYKVVSLEQNGVATPAEFLELIQKVVIKDGMLSIYEGKEGKAIPRSARLTAVAMPKPMLLEVDIVPLDDAKKDQKYAALVKSTKDGVVFCWPEGEVSARPTDFISTKDNKQTLLTLKRTRE